MTTREIAKGAILFQPVDKLMRFWKKACIFWPTLSPRAPGSEKSAQKCIPPYPSSPTLHSPSLLSHRSCSSSTNDTFWGQGLRHELVASLLRTLLQFFLEYFLPGNLCIFLYSSNIHSSSGFLSQLSKLPSDKKCVPCEFVVLMVLPSGTPPKTYSFTFLT